MTRRRRADKTTQSESRLERMTTVDGVEYAIITSSLTGDTTGHGKMWVSLETGITVKGEGEIQTKNEAGEPTVGKVSAFVVRPDGTPLIP